MITPGNVTDQTCTYISRLQEEDPVGSAPSYQRYLLVELSPPWPFDAVNSQHFPQELSEFLKNYTVENKDFRFQAFVSDTYHSPAEHIRVFYFSAPAYPFARFDKREFVVRKNQLSILVKAILQNSDELSQFDHYLQPSANTRELFVCTHGSRDVCCSKFGYPIYAMLNDEKYTTASDEKVRAWRISHLGGHRSAPTLLDFPEGRYWARVTPDIVDQLIHRKAKVTDLTAHYRGWAMLGPFEQVAEHELFTKFGWDWIHYRKQSSCGMKDKDTAIVRIEYASPDNAIEGTYETEVYVKGTVTIGGCGQELDEVNQYGLRPPRC